jgi:hypothetical protein
MTAKASISMPEGMNRGNRPKAPIGPTRKSAPPKPNALTLEQAFEIMFEKYEDALEELGKV